MSGIEVPSYLREAYEMVTRAYPNGLPKEDYPSLLFILSSNMSERNIGELMGCCSFKDPIIARNDVAAVLSVRRPSQHDLDRVYSRLKEAGLADWLKDQ